MLGPNKWDIQTWGKFDFFENICAISQRKVFLKFLKCHECLMSQLKLILKDLNKFHPNLKLGMKY